MKRAVKCLSFLLSLIILISTSLLFVSALNDSYYSWVGSWSTSPVKSGVMIGNTRVSDILTLSTVRIPVTMTTGGDSVRLRFTNKYGDSTVTIDSVRIARTNLTDEKAIIDGSSSVVTFDGQRKLTLPPNGYVYSDPIKMSVKALEKLSISMYFSSPTWITTAGLYGATSYLALGNRINDNFLNSATPITLTSGTITYYTIPFLCGVDVDAKDSYASVFLGDSTIANQAPYLLAEKLVAGGVENVGILQSAIVANRLLHSGEGVSMLGTLYGESTIKRYFDDALNLPGVKKIFVKVGLNDILHPMTKSMADKAPYSSVEEIIDGYKTLIRLAHAKGIKIYFFGRTPFKGYSRDFFMASPDDLVWTKEADDKLNEINNWLKNTDLIDGYIDVDSMRDPSDTGRLRPQLTTDGAHLSHLGQVALVDLIPLEFFNVNPSSFKSMAAIQNVDPYKTATNTPTTTAPSFTFPPDTQMPNLNDNTTTPSMPINSEPLDSQPFENDTDGTEYFWQDTNNVNATEDTNYQEPIVEIPGTVENLSFKNQVGIVILSVLAIVVIGFGSVYIIGKRKGQ